MNGKNKVTGCKGFHHLALRVSNIDASIKFYSDVLGFKLKMDFPHPWDEKVKKIAFLDTGDGNYLELFSNASSGNHLDTNTAGEFFHVAFRPKNMDAIIERAREAGVEITLEPSDVHLESDNPTDVKVAYLQGLDGETIELIENKDKKGVTL
jgi:catechol 2,3-dioxygenase-like lactoylglutathione lyase family enzyme